MKTEIRAYNLKQLGVLYNVDRRTLNKWLKPFINDIGEKHGALYTRKQVEVIFEKLGHPD